MDGQLKKGTILQVWEYWGIRRVMNIHGFSWKTPHRCLEEYLVGCGKLSADTEVRFPVISLISNTLNRLPLLMHASYKGQTVMNEVNALFEEKLFRSGSGYLISSHLLYCT